MVSKTYKQYKRQLIIYAFHNLGRYADLKLALPLVSALGSNGTPPPDISWVPRM